MHYGQMLQSHALHFFHLSSPDLLFGFDSEVARRNIVGVAQAHPEIARKGIFLRKFGQEVIRITAGKRVHGTGCGARRREQAGDGRGARQPEARVAPDAGLGQDAVDMAKQLHAQNPALYNRFGSFRSNLLSLVRPDGAMDFYDGVLRARDADGKILFDGVSDQRYWSGSRKKCAPGAT
jgi:NAD-reducing hydrogenase large subunit